MASYSLCFKPSVHKDLRPLPQPVVARVFEQISALQNDPFPRGTVKLAGTERLYRVRVGDYRIVYEVDDAEKQVTIHYIRHRSAVYREI